MIDEQIRLERGLQLVSSVFFVTEQLPEEYRAYVLWSPTAHGMQLLRAAYFPGYASSDWHFGERVNMKLSTSYRHLRASSDRFRAIL